MQTATTGAALSLHLPVRQEWLDRRREEIIEPDLAIVDPHHHLVERPETGRYLLPELLADLGSGHNITATVYLEWLSMYRATGPAELRPVGEVEFANGVAAMAASETYGKTQVCAGIVGYADLTLGASVEKVLEAMIAAGGGRFRGIRFITATHPDQSDWGSPVRRPESLLMDTPVREGFVRLAPLGLSFDAWMYHAQLPELADLARAFPETQIVLDHVGGPIGLGRYAGKRDEVFAEWSGRIRELAGCPNMHIKLGGLGMRMFGFDLHTRELPPSSEELAAAWRPYIVMAGLDRVKPGHDDKGGVTAMAARMTSQQALWLELMQFYIREAWLLDERKLKEWLDLFTDDVLYFMPRRKNVPRRELHRELTPLGDLAIFEEDKRYLEMRVARLDTGMAWAEDPPSRTRHLIGNLEAASLENGEVEAKTAFLVYRSHLETDHQLLSGCREDLLRKVEGAWKVKRRTIVLDANVLLDKNLSVFL